MKIGDKVKFVEERKFGRPQIGDTGIVVDESKDGIAILIRLYYQGCTYQDKWVMKESVEVNE